MGTQINVLDDIQIKHWVNKGAPIARSDGGGLTFTLSEAGPSACAQFFAVSPNLVRTPSKPAR
jgi:hypothetical protein